MNKKAVAVAVAAAVVVAAAGAAAVAAVAVAAAVCVLVGAKLRIVEGGLHGVTDLTASIVGVWARGSGDLSENYVKGIECKRDKNMSRGTFSPATRFIPFTLYPF